MTISGTIKGRLIRANPASVPLKRGPLIMARAAATARIVAVVAAATAMISELAVALWMFGLLKAFRYQSKLNPPQVVIDRIELNE